MRMLAALVVVGGVAVGVAAAAPKQWSIGARERANRCPETGGSSQVGKVSRVAGVAFQGTKRLVKGAPLYRGATLCTEAPGPRSGQVTFTIKSMKPVTCTMLAGARLRLVPPKTKPGQKQVVIRFEAGRTHCATAMNPSRQLLFQVRNGPLRLYVDDPTFLVDTNPARTTVKVQQGFLRVGGRDGASVTVRAGQQTVVPRAGRPNPVVALRASAEDRAVFNSLVPRPAQASRHHAARSACGSKSGYGRTVGTVTKATGAVYQGPDRLKKGSKLKLNALLCAGQGIRSGVVTFEITRLKKTTCAMRARSRLRLYPRNTSVLIRFEQGDTYCTTAAAPPGPKKFEVRKGWVRLLVDDPLFAVSAAKRSIVKVKVGSLSVAGSRGPAVLVGPGQQTTVPTTGPAQEPVPIQETAADKKEFGGLGSAVPKPDFSRPAVGSSPTLKRIFANGAIVAGLNDVERDPGVDPFLANLFEFLAASWRINLRKVVDDTGGLVKAMESGTLDVAITSELTPPYAPFETMPLLTDSQGEDWYVTFVPDKGFLQALETFVRNAVNAGKYSSVYRAAFKTEPSFDILKPVLFG